ncbi:hypothetical protein BSKO_12181 [Bryopsis sp. KO-2023]|nr:hypothetical protein BSKO_12181 [Bryopsis sp. KO-2023]
MSNQPWVLRFPLSFLNDLQKYFFVIFPLLLIVRFGGSEGKEERKKKREREGERKRESSSGCERYTQDNVSNTLNGTERTKTVPRRVGKKTEQWGERAVHLSSTWNRFKRNK